MRHAARLAISFLACATILLVTACGGGGGGSGSGGPLPSFTVGVTVSGLTGTVVLQNNGGDNLTITANGAATFSAPVTSRSTYAVSVFRQPAAEYCSVSNGAGTMGGANVAGIVVTCLRAAWTWVGGSNAADAAGRHGTRGVASSTSIPGAREGAGSWRNSIGFVWILGGTGRDSAGTTGELNDLWSYCECDGTREWLWLTGSSTVNAPGVYGMRGVADGANTPGARHGGSSWTDQYGNLWLLGGRGVDAAGTQDLLNDLWKYTTSTVTWQWLGGADTVRAAGTYGTRSVPSAANAPGARRGAQSWASADGLDLWLFGGDGIDASGAQGSLDDLWRYSTPNATWAWVAGSSTVSNAGGVYGTRGTPAAGNRPGARIGASTWTDSGGALWLFGGVGLDSAGVLGSLGDLWSYSPGSGLWTWIAGPAVANAAGTYGVLGTASVANAPGARQGASAFLRADGKVWLFGGTGLDSAGSPGNLNDLWTWDPVAATWTWVAGADVVGVSGNYGTLGVISATNAPGSRAAAVSWTDPAGTLWLFGGQGAAAITSGALNDLWVYTP